MESPKSSSTRYIKVKEQYVGRQTDIKERQINRLQHYCNTRCAKVFSTSYFILLPPQQKR